jgi:hypothetical protein
MRHAFSDFFDVYYGDGLWLDFNYWEFYEYVQVLEGTEYVRFHMTNQQIDSPYPDHIYSVNKFFDPGDNFKATGAFWASFDAAVPPSGGAKVKIRMINFMPQSWRDTCIYNIDVYRSFCQLDCYAYPEIFHPFQDVHVQVIQNVLPIIARQRNIYREDYLWK